MDLPAELAESIQTQLLKYLMLFRGTSMEVLGGGRVTGLLGEQAALAVSPEAGQLVEDGDTLTLPQGYLFRTTDTAEGQARYEFWQTGEQGPATNSLNQPDHSRDLAPLGDCRWGPLPEPGQRPAVRAPDAQLAAPQRHPFQERLLHRTGSHCAHALPRPIEEEPVPTAIRHRRSAAGGDRVIRNGR